MREVLDDLCPESFGLKPSSLGERRHQWSASYVAGKIAIEMDHKKRYNLTMCSGIIIFGTRIGALFGIALLMLAPTGMCLCAEQEDESTSEQHEPGCPEVRKLDQPVNPVQVTPDLSSVPLDLQVEVSLLAASSPVFSVGHGPPRGQPIYIAQRSLLI